MSFLRLQGLVKRFGDFLAVDDVNLEVEKGEFVSLLGPSGCGKTTTLQMIAGFEEPTEGRIFVDGKDITGIKASQRGIGIVFQSYALFPHMTVFQNVSFGLEMRKVAEAERKARVMETLELVHLGDFARRFPRELSGGQQQRVALARALVIKPEVLLLDEPLSALDAKIREDMQIELRGIQRTVGTTTILVTHDQSEALSMSDRVAVMNEGRLVQVDLPYQAYEFPDTAFVSSFLGKSNRFSGVVTGRANGKLTVKVGDLELEAEAGRGPTEGPVQLSVRPEKLLLTAPAEGRFKGRVHTRIFLGNHWVYQIESPFGPLLASHHNSGTQSVAEGEEVGLTWAVEELRVLAPEAGDG
jgi:putative spermidine/putrescine transport system ATP-binding protein